MKRIFIAMMVALTFCMLPANAQKKTTLIQDSIGKVKITVSQTKKAKNNQSGITVVGVDTAETGLTAADDSLTEEKYTSFTFDSDDDGFPFNDFDKPIRKGITVAIVSIIAVFGLPVFIVFIVFFFRYKNRKARYRLAEKAVAAGQPLPEEFIYDQKQKDRQAQGIKNTFTGIGLFIFLWAITGSFGIGAIGLLIMFMGIGQWIIERQKEKKEEASYRGRTANGRFTDRNSGRFEENEPENDNHRNDETR